MIEKHKKLLDLDRWKVSSGDAYWVHVNFSDRKRFRLDDPDGLTCYSHDLQTEPLSFTTSQRESCIADDVRRSAVLRTVWSRGCRRQHKLWTMLFYYGSAFASAGCQIIWKIPILKISARRIFFNRSEYADSWLRAQGGTCLKKPASSVDLECIENVWDLMLCRVKRNIAQFNRTHHLEEAICVLWKTIH